MSTRFPPSTDRPWFTRALTRSSPLAKFGAILKPPLQFVSFWGAVGLPFALLGMLAQGLESPTTVASFLCLLTLNVLALYAGHGYNRP